MLSGEGGGAAGEVLDGPRADPASPWQAVLQLRQVAALSASAGDALPEPEGWSGPAADACRSARSECASRLDTAAGVAGTVAAVLSRLARAVEQTRAEVARAQRELTDVEAERARRAARVAAGLPDPGWADLGARVRSARARHAAATAEYARTTTAAAQALAALYAQVPAAQWGMTTADRAWQAWRASGGPSPSSRCRGLSPSRWESSWTGPSRQGGAAGAMAGMAVGGVWRVGREARLLTLGERQTLDEIRQGVRLRLHEGPGHTLARHVRINDRLEADR